MMMLHLFLLLLERDIFMTPHVQEEQKIWIYIKLHFKANCRFAKLGSNARFIVMKKYKCADLKSHSSNCPCFPDSEWHDSDFWAFCSQQIIQDADYSEAHSSWASACCMFVVCETVREIMLPPGQLRSQKSRRRRGALTSIRRIARVVRAP